MGQDRTKAKAVRPRATPPLTLVDTQVRQTDIAVYIDVLFKDADDRLWRTHTSAFMFDLERNEDAKARLTSLQSEG